MKWKRKHGLKATYRNLLQCFCEARHEQGAEAVCEVLRKKWTCELICCSIQL